MVIVRFIRRLSYLFWRCRINEARKSFSEFSPARPNPPSIPTILQGGSSEWSLSASSAGFHIFCPLPAGNLARLDSNTPGEIVVLAKAVQEAVNDDGVVQARLLPGEIFKGRPVRKEQTAYGMCIGLLIPQCVNIFVFLAFRGA